MCEHLYTKEVQAIPFLCLILYSLFPNCIQNDVTAQRFSLDDRLEKPKSLLLLSLESSIRNLSKRSCIILNSEQIVDNSKKYVSGFRS